MSSSRALGIAVLLLLAAWHDQAWAQEAAPDEASLPVTEEPLAEPYDEELAAREAGYFPPAPGWLWRRPHGAFVLRIGGDLGIAPAGSFPGGNRAMGGVGGELLIAPRRSPLLFGVSAGALWFERKRRTQYGPWGWEQVDGGLFHGSWEYGRDSIVSVRSVQLRHAEFISRFQPWYGAVRPYLEACVGVAILWSGSRVDGEFVDRARSAALLYGGTLGVDVQLRPHGGRNLHVFTLTFAVRRLQTGRLHLTRYVGSGHDADAPVSTRTDRGSLGLWVPTVMIGFAY